MSEWVDCGCGMGEDCMRARRKPPDAPGRTPLSEEIRGGANLLTVDGQGKAAKQATLNEWADEVAALEQERSTNEELISRYRADLDEEMAEVERLRDKVELLEGEVKAASDGSGITNISEQYEARIAALEQEQGKTERQLYEASHDRDVFQKGLRALEQERDEWQERDDVRCRLIAEQGAEVDRLRAAIREYDEAERAWTALYDGNVPAANMLGRRADEWRERDRLAEERVENAKLALRALTKPEGE